MSLHTPAPWAWRFPLGGLPELVHEGHGRLIVMDAVRDGMKRATMRFARRDPADLGGILYKAAEFFRAPGRRVPDVQVPDHPDMRLMAAAPDLLKAARLALAYFEACVEPTCDGDGRAMEANALRAAIVLAEHGLHDGEVRLSTGEIVRPGVGRR
jgi:hypothetical protein